MGDEGTLVLSHESQGLLFREARAEKLTWQEFAHKDDKGGVVLDSQATKGAGARRLHLGRRRLDIIHLIADVVYSAAAILFEELRDR